MSVHVYNIRIDVRIIFAISAFKQLIHEILFLDVDIFQFERAYFWLLYTAVGILLHFTLSAHPSAYFIFSYINSDIFIIYCMANRK